VLIKIEKIFYLLYIIISLKIGHNMASVLERVYAVPTAHTLDAYEFHHIKIKECSQCGQECCLPHTRALTNPNPVHHGGTNVKYVIPFCSKVCLNTFTERCLASTPFPLSCTFQDSCLGSGLWMMFSLIPEQMDGGNGWVIAQCDERGNYIYDDRGRFIWQWVADSVLRTVVSEPLSN
jgi:hypothetical protein